MKRCAFVLLLILCCNAVFAQTFNPSLIKYTDSIFRKVVCGDITAYNVQLKRIPKEILYEKYVAAKPGNADNINDNFYTSNTAAQGRFINSFHFGLFEGLLGLPDLPSFLFDTLTYKAKPGYTIFRLYEYNNDGSFKGKKQLFLLPRKYGVTNKNTVLNTALKNAADSANKVKVNLLQTTDGRAWSITQVYEGNKIHAPDDCQKKYRLLLKEDMHFEQYYTDVSSFQINKKAAVDSGMERGFYYPEGKPHIQCYLENETGIWTLNKGLLALMTSNGIKRQVYKIVRLKKDSIELQLNSYRLLLSKIPDGR